MSTEAASQQPLGVQVQAHLESIPVLQKDPSLPNEHPVNTGRAVITGMVRPVVMYLLEAGVNIANLNSPEKIIAHASTREDLNLGEDLAHKLGAYQEGEYRDWGLEATVMSLELDEHPLH